MAVPSESRSQAWPPADLLIVEAACGHPWLCLAPTMGVLSGVSLPSQRRQLQGAARCPGKSRTPVGVSSAVQGCGAEASVVLGPLSRGAGLQARWVRFIGRGPQYKAEPQLRSWTPRADSGQWGRVGRGHSGWTKGFPLESPPDTSLSADEVRLAMAWARPGGALGMSGRP